MILNKFVTYLHNIGLVFVALSFIVSLALFHNLAGSTDNNILYHLLLFGVLMCLPLCFYKLWHFKQYKEDNKDTLIHWGIYAVMFILFLIFKR
jgi:membrane protease YdiL (CAAX protease family)